MVATECKRLHFGRRGGKSRKSGKIAGKIAAFAVEKI